MSAYFDESHPETEEHLEELRRSYKAVGPIRKVIINARTSEPVSGSHRLAAVPEWPKEERDFTPIQAEVFALHDNVQRRMPEAETSRRLNAILTLIMTEGVPESDCFSEFLRRGWNPSSEAYMRRLAADRFKHASSETSPPSSKTEPTSEIPPTSLEEAVTRMWEAKQEKKPYGALIAAREPVSGLPFGALLKHPVETFDALNRGAGKSTVLKLALGDDAAKDETLDRFMLHAPEAGNIFEDDRGRRFRVWALEKQGRVVRFEGEEL